MVDPWSALLITMFLFVVSSLSALRCAVVRLSFFSWMCFSGLSISSRILWMKVSRLLLPQLVSMLVAFLLVLLGQCFWFLVYYFDRSVKRMYF